MGAADVGFLFKAQAMDNDDLGRYVFFGLALLLGVAITIWQQTRSE